MKFPANGLILKFLTLYAHDPDEVSVHGLIFKFFTLYTHSYANNQKDIEYIIKKKKKTFPPKQKAKN